MKLIKRVKENPAKTAIVYDQLQIRDEELYLY